MNVLTSKEPYYNPPRGPFKNNFDPGPLPGHKTQPLWVNKKLDLALLQTDLKDTDIQSEQIECHNPPIGAEIEAVGNPLFLHFIHTWGHIAGPEHDDLPDGATEVLPSDITAAPGMSGGPVFDKQHKIIGIISAILTMEKLGEFPLTLIIPGSTICKLLAKE